MSDVKLLPCPFCGGEIKLDEDDFILWLQDAVEIVKRGGADE